MLEEIEDDGFITMYVSPYTARIDTRDLTSEDKTVFYNVVQKETGENDVPHKCC